MYIDELMQIGAWLVDGDGDGHPDGLDVAIVIADGLASSVYLAAAQLAARLGLEVAALSLPICYLDTEQVAPAGWRVVVGCIEKQSSRLSAVPVPTTGQARAVLVGRDLLIDGAHEQMAKLLQYLAAWLPAGAADWSADAVLLDAAELVWYRQGQEVRRCPLPRQSARPAQPERRTTCLSKLYGTEGLLTDSDGDFLPDNWSTQDLPVAQSMQEWVAVINLAARWGLESLGLTFTDVHASEQFDPLVVPGQQQTTPGIWLEDGRLKVSGTAEQRAAVWRYLAEQYPSTPAGQTWAELALYLEGLARETSVDANWQEIGLEWEVDEVKRKWQELLQAVAGSVTGEVRVSEPLSVRQRLASELREMARQAGVKADVTVRSAYKQGLLWVKEEVMPQLAALGQVDCITIEVAPFQVSDALDPEARWLLELYPADLVLAESLGISPDQVVFELKSGLESTYRLSAWSNGNRVLTSSLDVWYTCQPYLPQIGDVPLVHPPTGGISITGSHVKFVRVATDAERVFAAYQKEILPGLLAVVQQTGSLESSRQPFFERLELQVSCSEPEELLGVREEMVSVADALHEDIYFVGLDLFKRMGEQNGQVLRAPGLILPDIRVRQAVGPSLRYRLVPKRREQSVSRPRLTEMIFNDGGISGTRWDWEMTSHQEAMRVHRLLQAAERQQGLPAHLILRYPGGDLTVDIQLHPAEPTVVAEAEQDVIYLEECKARLDSLQDKPGMQVSLVGVSRQGRHIYSVAATSETSGRIISPAKFAGWKPTWLLNNRHHANEVSSTNAALDLMQSLGEGSRLSELLKRINVVCIPMENVDGAAIHQQLAQTNPRHKLHAARFNSQGREFADAYFQGDPTVPEARALPDVWRTWVPDVVVDNHGIPSHEWEQPFSGYLCPWFASFWIPRSLFYAYFWLTSGPEQTGRLAASWLEQAVTSRLVADHEINLRNQELLASWRKYFVPYLEDHFSGEERGGVMWYYVPYSARQGRFASHRWPELTILDWTTEVADETARGEYLGMCSRAHRIAQEACLEWLAEQPVQLQRVSQPVDGGWYRKLARQRPLIVKGASK